MSSEVKIEPFPTLVPIETESQNPPNVSPSHEAYSQATSPGAGHARSSRSQSLIQSFITSNPPLGMWQATGEVGSKIPTLPEIHDGSFGEGGWTQEGQMEHRGTNPYEIHRRMSRARRTSTPAAARTTVTPTITTSESQIQRDMLREESTHAQNHECHGAVVETMLSSIHTPKQGIVDVMAIASATDGPDETGSYPNGYRFPKKHTWSQSIVIGLKAFWTFFSTPLGFLITIYGLNVIGWGAMIFFVLINAAPAMCHPSCNDKYSARNVWIEIDAQVLTALFCVTAFGLIPWRFRDFYYLMRWRLFKKWDDHRKLAGIYRSWYRLPGSDKLSENVAPPPTDHKNKVQSEDGPSPYSEQELTELKENGSVPLPLTSIPDPPLTGIRAKPTKSWNLDIVIWMYMLNTWIQGALCGIMWGMNRFNRPSWATGFLISIGCITGIVAGIVVFVEGSKIKKAEGIPVKEYDVVESVEDYQKRKAKEDTKHAKKQPERPQSEEPGVQHVEKLKGKSWFTRH